MNWTESCPVGVIAERRDEESEWLDHSWAVVDVVVGGSDMAPWTELARGEGWIRYFAGAALLEVFRRETEGYKYNLSLPEPLVFVVLRAGEDDDENDIELDHVTACPYEAQSCMDADGLTVDSVPMPPQLVAWLAEFIEQHHTDLPFRKRKQKPKVTEAEPPPALARRLRGGGPR